MTKGVILRLPIFVAIWLVYLFVIKIPVNFLGLFVIPFMWRYRNTEYKSLPAWTRLWSNLEDWHGQVNHYASSLPRWWAMAHGINFWSFYRYHAIRNGGDGLRSIEWLDLDVDKDKVKYWTTKFFTIYEPATARTQKLSTIGYIAWQGWQAGMKVVHIWNDERHFVTKIGWRVEPSDAIAPRGPASLHQNEGFATKFLVYRKG
ncbi:MAG: hypothetical protein ACR2PS_05555 [Pseudomonadales bacterium]